MDLSQPVMPPAALSAPSNSGPAQPRPPGISPLNSKLNEARWYTEEDWNAQRAKITELYEANTLNNLMRFMTEQHGLKATQKQYKDRIKSWGLNKNIQRHEMEAMVRKQQKRKAESNKLSAFRIRGRPVNPEKIRRYIKEHLTRPVSASTDKNRDSNIGLAGEATPEDISCYTPSDSGSITTRDDLGPQTISHQPLTVNNSSQQHSDNYSTPANPAENGEGGMPPPQSYGGYLPPYGGYSHAPPLPPGPFVYSHPFPQQYGGYGPPSVNANASVHGNPQAPPPPPEGTIGFGQGAPQSYTFQYSNCTGSKKALLIGINYFGQRGELSGCINDVRNMGAFLNETFGYRRENMVILTDDQKNPMSQPTKQNMLRAMHWLVKDARPNDSLFFHYSGHGGQTKDENGGKEDGYDEIIYPVDFRKVGHIVDDEMHSIMVKPLQPGVRLTALFDSCHSGTALDLPYIYSTQGLLKEPNLAKEAGQALLGIVPSYAQKNRGGIADSVMGYFKKLSIQDGKSEETLGDGTSRKTFETKTSPADVIMWSSSKDDQTSADANIAKQATGAMSWAFITAMKKNPQQSYAQLQNSMLDELMTKYTQKPQLSCSHPLNTNLLFTM